MAHLGHLAVHIDDVCVALLGIARETAGLVYVVAGALALFVSHGVGIHHLAIDFYGSVILGNDDAVTFAQFNVFVTARIGKCFVQFDTYIVGAADVEFLQVGSGCVDLAQCGGIVAGSNFFQTVVLCFFALLSQNFLHAETFCFIDAAFQSGSFHVGQIINTACGLNKIA